MLRKSLNRFDYKISAVGERPKFGRQTTEVGLPNDRKMVGK
jgi:hypothetical protein